MRTSTPGLRRLAGFGAAAAVTGTAVNTAIFGIGRAAGVDYVAATTRQGPQLIHVQHVVSLSLMSFAVGLAVTAIATGVGRPSVRVIQILATVVAVLSVGMDVGIDSTLSAKTSLAAMHLVMGLVFVACLRLASTTRAQGVRTRTGSPASQAVMSSAI